MRFWPLKPPWICFAQFPRAPMQAIKIDPKFSYFLSNVMIAGTKNRKRVSMRKMMAAIPLMPPPSPPAAARRPRD
jgi:hypothetical protein